MMRLARRASLLVAFHLLTSAATAHAECAWVIWRSFVHPTPELSYAPYVVTAYPTIKECEAALAVEVALLKGEGWEPHYPHVRTVIAFKVQDGTRTATHLRCLPDGTDPRGPKGGTR